MSSLNKLLLRPKDGKDTGRSQPERSSSPSTSQSGSSSQQMPKVPIILKRTEGPPPATPGTTTPSSRQGKIVLAGQPKPAEEKSSQSRTAQPEKKKILLRSGTTSTSEGDRGGGSSSSSVSSLLEQLKAYEFPFDKAVPIIHNDLSFKSNRKFLKNLKSSYDYLVVTAIGPPKSGKTTILNYLAGVFEKTEFNCEPKYFVPRKDTDDEKACTFYITSHNMVLIEMAPIFNGCAAFDLIAHVDKYSTLESVTTAWNLRLMRWALSVSHLVIVTSLAVIEPKTIQLIHSAANLYPLENCFGGNSHPELIFVGNKCWLPSESKDQLVALCSTADVIGFGRRPRIKPNAFVLPHSKETRIPNTEAYKEFRRKVYDFDHWIRTNFTEDQIDGQPKIPQSQTLNDWFTFASNAWEEMGNSGYFHDYVRLLQ